MRLHLIDTDPFVVAAWHEAFADRDEVTIGHGNILDVAHDTVVSPANSYGFMDGGIDAAYSAFFGPGLQIAVQDRINARPEGRLPVGASVVVATGHPRIPHMIIAPTMETPEPVEAFNVFRAMCAVLRVAHEHRSVIRDVFCPGLCTGTGRVEAEEAAALMFRAYARWAE